MSKRAGSRLRVYASGPGLFLGTLLGLASCLLVPSAIAEQLPTSKLAAPATSLPQHRLELRALSEPEAVLALLPGLIEASRAKGDHRELALLYLAQANACRVIADWPCQRMAGAAAGEAARMSRQPILQGRALVSESRALMAMQDFSRGEQLLGRAELVLKDSPSPELSADVLLAYSSLSYALGKTARSAEYARRGLAALAGDQALPTQTRLLRNLARAQAQLGQTELAEASLRSAQSLTERFDDPKLSAELLLESARIARAAGNAEVQGRNGRAVLELASRLKNSQLAGLGHEVLGLAALDRGDGNLANRELGAAYESFHSIGLQRDEARVLRELIRIAIDQKQPRETIDTMTKRFLEIDGRIQAGDRAEAADDFDARLKYAQSEFDVLRLKDEAVLARERELALAQRNRQSQVLSFLAAMMLLVLGGFLLLQRRSNRRLETTMVLLRESEARAHDLLNLGAGFVFLHDLEGRLLLVNPAAAQVLGLPADKLAGRFLQEFQPKGSREDFGAYLQRLQAVGQDEGVFLIRSGHGDHRHWRYSSRLSVPKDGRAHVLGNAVDVTDQIHETQALHEQSVRDALTGVYNRRQLETFENDHPPGESWAAITVDLDHFKQINDTQGHDRGDQVLIEVAQFLLRRVRADDTVVRLGGDEFVVLLSRADEESMLLTMRRLGQDRAAAPCAFSLGMALREGDESLGATIARADAAMYAMRALERSKEQASR